MAILIQFKGVAARGIFEEQVTYFSVAFKEPPPESAIQEIAEKWARGKVTPTVYVNDEMVYSWRW